MNEELKYHVPMVQCSKINTVNNFAKEEHSIFYSYLKNIGKKNEETLVECSNLFE